MVKQLLSAKDLKAQTDAPMMSTNTGAKPGYISSGLPVNKGLPVAPAPKTAVAVPNAQPIGGISGVNTPSTIQQAVSTVQGSPAAQKDFTNAFAPKAAATPEQQPIPVVQNPADLDIALNDLVDDMSNVVKQGRTPDMAKLKQLYPEFSHLDEKVIQDLTADLSNVIKEGRQVDIAKLRQLYPELGDQSVANLPNAESIPQAAGGEGLPYADPLKPYTGEEGIAGYLGGTAANIPGSTWNIAAGIGNMLLHPIDTVKGGIKAISGAGANAGIAGISKITGDSEEEVKRRIYSEDNPVYNFMKDQLGVDLKENEEVADAMGTYFSQRYGGRENIKKSFKEDPVGIIGDVVSVLEGGVGMAGKAGLIDEASKVAMLEKLAKANPYTQVPNMVAKGTSAVVGGVAKGASNFTDMILNKVTAIDKEDRAFATKNPEITNQFINGTRTVDDVAEQLYARMDEAETNRAVLGQEYETMRASGQTADTSSIIANVNSDLAAKRISIGQDGGLVFDKFSKFNEPQQRAIKSAWKIIQDIKQEGSLDVDSILNIRQKLSDLVSWEGRPLKASAVDREAENLIKSFRAAVDKSAKQIPGMAKLDAKYGPALEEISTLRKDWFNPDGTLKDNALSKLNNLTNAANKSRLERLEALIPGITDEVRGLKVGIAVDTAMKARVGQYVQQMLLGGGIVSIFTNPAALVPLVTAGILLTPKNIIKILQRGASAQEGVANIIEKIKKGVRLTSDEAKVVEDTIQDTKGEIPMLIEQLDLDTKKTNANAKDIPSNSASSVDTGKPVEPPTPGPNGLPLNQ